MNDTRIEPIREPARPWPALTWREEQILRLLVESHVRDARPVGSERLVRHYGLPISPATVRNVMMSLTARRLITRSHRSAGREPTGSGYRYYVDRLMGSEAPSPRARRLLEEKLRRNLADQRAFLADLAHVVSVVSRQLGIVLVANTGPTAIHTLELVHLTGCHVMLVLRLDDGATRTLVLSLDREVSRRDLERARRFLAEEILGRDLGEARALLEEHWTPRLRREGQLLTLIAERLPELLVDEPTCDLILGPPGEIAMQAEFVKGERLRELLRLLEEPRPLVRTLFQPSRGGEVCVRIGSELGEKGLERLSTVSVSTSRGRGIVILGLLGPIRMNYPQSVALIDWLGSRLREVF